MEYEERNLKDNTITEDELSQWINKSDSPIKSFFNTRGKVYKDLGLKDKLDKMPDDEKIKLLSTDGMLIKRPIFITDDMVLVGFKEEEWKKTL